MNNRKNIAIVVQRYGMQVNGGAEMLVRMVAEKLIDKYEITVLTTCALDYNTWQPFFDEGESYENGIKIIRFKNNQRNQQLQEKFYSKVKHSPKVYIRYKIFKWFKKWIPFNSKMNFKDKNNIGWLINQGPESPQLLNYIKEHQNNFDVFMFSTSLYYPTALGILEVAEKSIILPNMHNEASSFFPIYQLVMKSAQWIMYNSFSEKKFSETIFPLQHSKSEVAATGINLPNLLLKNKNVLQKFNITKPYIIYIGRIDKSKGCDELINFFKKFLQETKQDIQLVMVGKSVLSIQEHPAIIFTGFVTDEERDNLLMNATSLIMSSKYESLSLVLLESFACYVPVIANGYSEVLRDHIKISNGGWYYTNYKDFKTSLIQLFDNLQLTNEKANNGFKYVATNYTWQELIRKYDNAIEDICNKNK